MLVALLCAAASGFVPRAAGSWRAPARSSAPPARTIRMLFGGAPHVVEHVMQQVTTSVYRPNMERALLHERERTRGDASRTCELPQLPLDWNVTGTRLRAGSGMLYEYL